jgi:hypothetical protein
MPNASNNPSCWRTAPIAEAILEEHNKLLTSDIVSDIHAPRLTAEQIQAALAEAVSLTHIAPIHDAGNPEAAPSSARTYTRPDIDTAAFYRYLANLCSSNANYPYLATSAFVRVYEEWRDAQQLSILLAPQAAAAQDASQPAALSDQTAADAAAGGDSCPWSGLGPGQVAMQLMKALGETEAHVLKLFIKYAGEALVPVGPCYR